MVIPLSEEGKELGAMCCTTFLKKRDTYNISYNKDSTTKIIPVITRPMLLRVSLFTLLAFATWKI